MNARIEGRMDLCNDIKIEVIGMLVEALGIQIIEYVKNASFENRLIIRQFKDGLKYVTDHCRLLETTS